MTVSPEHKTTPRLRRYANVVLTSDTVLLPRLAGYFSAQKFPQHVDARLIGRNVERKPDGWFHPSTHPGWSERQLYVYLTQPEHLTRRAWNYEGRMSANLGTMAHELVKEALLDDGCLIKPEGEFCGSCGLPRKGRGRQVTCNEHGFSDDVTGSRGHLDGLLNPKILKPINGLGGFDLKTSNEMSVKRLENNDVEYFRKKWPYYYDQMQEYMRISGLRYFIVLFLSLGYPWEMKEVRVDFDELRSYEIETKYLRVRTAVEEGVVPNDCCRYNPAVKSKDECPAADACRRGFK